MPKGSREAASAKFCSILDKIVSTNNIEAWENLLLFPRRCLHIPKRSGQRWSLASLVNRQIADENLYSLPPVLNLTRSARTSTTPRDPAKYLRKAISQKLGEGDFKGAIRLACSDDTLAEMNEDTFSALQAKHPPSYPSSSLPLPLDPSQDAMISVTSEMVACAIRSFPAGSSGGPDGFLPQHLKDMLNPPSGVISPFLTALSSFISHVLNGNIPVSIRPVFFGARLVALTKRNGGVRPIAVGLTLRRLVAKVAIHFVLDDVTNLLAPRQLGVGVKGGAEAAVHAARSYLRHLRPGNVMVKLDFRNAFNSIRRDRMLEATRSFTPDIYPFVHSSYSAPSSLFWGEKVILSSEGVQQGDTLGPLLFSLTILRPTMSLMSEFCVCYLDDITLGGPVDSIQRDLQLVHTMGEEIHLSLNSEKSEIIGEDRLIADSVLSFLPGARSIEPVSATLLGSPLGNVDCVSAVLEEKLVNLARIGNRLVHLTAHDSLILLRHSIAIPKLLYVLRTAPCFLSPRLPAYDEKLCSIVSSICNVHMTTLDSAWSQASLPVRSGGLGLRSAVQLAPSAFMASAAASKELMSQILPDAFTNPEVDAALTCWSDLFCDVSPPPPTGDDACAQRAWDSPVVTSSFKRFLNNAADAITRARLLAVSVPESGAWLNALPITSLGLRLDDSTIRVAVGLRLGLPLARPHLCRHCSATVDKFSVHPLSCKRSEGRFFRHSSINSIIHRAFTAAAVPARLEPTGLARTDGKRPDGVTMVPWECGKCVVWDFTCPDTLANSYRAAAVSSPGSVAAQAESKKIAKYSSLDSSLYKFVPIAIETMGTFGTRSLKFIKDLGKRIALRTGDPLAPSHLIQRLAVEIQRGNSASVLSSTC